MKSQNHINITQFISFPRIAGINTLRPRQNGRHFPEDIFKRIFMNENVCISIKISLKIVPMCPDDNIPALAHIMAWRLPCGEPFSEPLMVSLLTHICVTRPQWVKFGSRHRVAYWLRFCQNPCSSVRKMFGRQFTRQIGYMVQYCLKQNSRRFGLCPLARAQLCFSLNLQKQRQL